MATGVAAALAAAAFKQLRWTEEEHEYAAAIVVAFKAGRLPLPGHTKLGVLLQKLLRCNQSRMSRKLPGVYGLTYDHRLQQQGAAADSGGGDGNSGDGGDGGSRGYSGNCCSRADLDQEDSLGGGG
ncbi:unnamed protein product, partial [Phaeothamnion confervicola]